jgi:hypothetical protein
MTASKAAPAPIPGPDPPESPKKDESPVKEWYEKYDAFIWSKIHKALESKFDAKANPEDADIIRGRKLDLADELHAGIWLHITENWPKYKDQGHKRGPMAWLGTVSVNFIRDCFKIEENRQRLRPTESLGGNPEEEDETAYRYTEEKLPSRPVRPSGYGPMPDESDD